ncbi:Protein DETOXIFICATION 46, chloroplastic [Cucurbita argyrosperma subsp. argyrosperma]|nr:Protein DETOXIFICATION 46, chloroplastic [Cucurbita argyrosperma subsp. argyrosperma]
MASVILHSPFSVIARIHNPNNLRTLSPPSFPTIFFRSSSSPLVDLSSRINRRLAVPRRRHEWEVGCLEIESEIGIEVQENELLSGSGVGGEELGTQGLLTQMKEIVTFTGPAIGLWICGPLMSLIDTAVIGQGSAVELAALEGLLQDKNEVQHHISVLLFVGLISGFLMLLVTKLLGSVALTAFVGTKNADIIPAANTYIQIRGLAWPAILTGWVAQSASLGMKDSWGPLKALAVASIVNGIGDVVLCMFLGYGIAGAAWATMVSQVIAAYMMIETLNKKAYNGYSLSVPSSGEFFSILGLAAPVFLTMMSKVVFYSLLIYYATSMGTHTMAAHQVMIQTFCMCTVWGEPLSQTAQSFMPGLINGVNRSLDKARMLLKSLLIIGAIFGFVLGSIGTLVPWLFPYLFTPEDRIIQEMHKVLIPYFLALVITPPTHSLEGTLLAGRDLKFISLSMTGCLSLGALVLLVISTRGYGLTGCWYALTGFQWARFLIALRRILSPNGMLYSSDLSHYKLEKPKAA